MADSVNPWWVVVASIVAPAIIAYINSRGGWQASRQSAEDKREEREEAIRAGLDARQERMLATVERQRDAAVERAEEAERDRDEARRYALLVLHRAANRLQARGDHEPLPEPPFLLPPAE